MKVYVIRHGESENNLSQNWTGWGNAHLTEKGREEARIAGSIIEGICFNKVFTSDLARAMETAEEALPNVPYETSPLLREINVGELSGNPISCVEPEKRLLLHEHGFAEFGGEQRTEFNQRIETFLHSLESLNCDTVAVFAHRGVLLGLLDAVLGTVISRKHICCYNCTVAVFEYVNETWRLHSWINPER